MRDLNRLLSMVAETMTPGGSVVFSVEHPIYNATTTQELETSDTGERIWPLDNYLVEGEQVTNWFVNGIYKEHRTVATYMNTAVEAALVLDQIDEWGPTAKPSKPDPNWQTIDTDPGSCTSAQRSPTRRRAPDQNNDQDAGWSRWHCCIEPSSANSGRRQWRQSASITLPPRIATT